MSNTAEPIHPQCRRSALLYWSIALALSVAALSLDGHAQTPSNGQDTGSPPAQASTSADAAKPDQYYSLERQIQLGEFVPVIKQLEQQIKSIEEAQHRYHANLIKPLTLLGDALHGAENYPAALDAYGRAVHLTRVDSGLHSAEQVAGVYREAKVYHAAGDIEQANDREQYAWRVLQKTHGRYSPKLLPGIRHLAAWYRQTNNVLGARSLYMRAVRIVEANYNELHPEMVNALRGLAKTYRQERFPGTYLNRAEKDVASLIPKTSIAEDNAAVLLNRFPHGERALKRVVRIQQTKLALLQPMSIDSVTTDNKPVMANDTPVSTAPNPTAPDPKALAKARQELMVSLVELGDWYMLFDRSRIAMQYYTQAEAINATLLPGQTTLDLSQPQLLHFPAPGDPRAPKERYRGERKEGFVELTYTITVRGTIANLTTVGSAPKGLMDYRVRRSMLSARYRPTFVGGAPISTPQHKYRHRFNYYPSKPDPTKVDKPKSEPALEVPTDTTTSPANAAVALTHSAVATAE